MATPTVPRQSRNPFSAPRRRSLRKIFLRQRNTLELLLPRGWPQQPGMIQWKLRQGSGVAPHGHVTELNQIPGVSDMTRVFVWTPPSDSLLTRVSLPTRSRAKIQQALPYALEDQLVAEPDSLHFSYRMAGDGNLDVAVTGKDRVQAWLTKLNEAGLRPTGFCPAVLALPIDSRSWTVAFHGNDIWVRTGIASGFSCAVAHRSPPALLGTSLLEAQEKKHAPAGLVILHPPAGFEPDAWSGELKLPLTIQKLDWWPSHHEAIPELNLLQGSFAPSRQMQEMLPGLRPAAIMLGIWMAGSLGFSTWEWWNLKATHTSQRAEMERIFRATFPDAKAVQDPPLQMQRLLGELQAKSGKSAPADALPLLGQIAPVLQAHPRMKLRGIQYGESRLTVDFSLPDFQAMESVKSAFTARGMNVEVLSANSSPAGIEGRLRLGHTGRTGV